MILTESSMYLSALSSFYHLSLSMQELGVDARASLMAVAHSSGEL